MSSSEQFLPDMRALKKSADKLRKAKLKICPDGKELSECTPAQVKKFWELDSQIHKLRDDAKRLVVVWF